MTIGFIAASPLPRPLAAKIVFIRHRPRSPGPRLFFYRVRCTPIERLGRVTAAIPVPVLITLTGVLRVVPLELVAL